MYQLWLLTNNSPLLWQCVCPIKGCSPLFVLVISSLLLLWLFPVFTVNLLSGWWLVTASCGLSQSVLWHSPLCWLCISLGRGVKSPVSSSHCLISHESVCLTFFLWIPLELSKNFHTPLLGFDSRPLLWLFYSANIWWCCHKPCTQPCTPCLKKTSHLYCLL